MDNTKVALRKESVDRNADWQPQTKIIVQSLSARRAWIEMRLIVRQNPVQNPSLSARRAWIEMKKK